MKIKKCILGLLIVLTVSGYVFAQDYFTGAKGAKPDELAAILKDPAESIGNKTNACKIAALQGKADVVPVLSGYLGDSKLSHPVRIALLQIPGPEADKALCDSLKTVKDLSLIPGILRTLGERKNASSVSSVIPFLTSDNLSVYSAAVFALGKITGKEAADALENAWKKADPKHRSILVSGLIACALKADPENAKRIYNSIRTAKDLHPRQRSIGFQRLFIISNNDERQKLLTEAFAAPEKEFFSAGLQLAEFISNDQLAKILIGDFDKYDKTKKLAVLDILKNYKSKVSAQFVYDIAVTPGDVELRLGALKTLGRVGDASFADGLFKSAAVAAKSAVPWDVVVLHLFCLGNIEDPKMDEIVIKMVNNHEGFLWSFMLNLAAARHLRACLPVYLKEISTSKDKWDRIAASSACANTMKTTELPILLELQKGKPKENQECIREVILRLVRETNNRELTAQVIEKILPTADRESKAILYTALTYTRNNIALKIFKEVIKGSDKGLQDEVLKALGEWPDYHAYPVLQEAAKTVKDERLQIRAVRGFIRIIRQMQLGGEHRVQLAQSILPYIKRSEEMKLLIEAVGRSDSPKAIEFVKPYLDQPEYKETACISMFHIGKCLNITDPKIISMLENIEKITANKVLKEEINDLLKGIVVKRH